jgi:hypothetical protein
MAITRQVITTVRSDGSDALGTRTVAYKIADESIVSGSLLTVESNHFCVLKSRGAVLDVYETGQYAIETPDKPLIGSIAKGFSAVPRPGSTKSSTSTAPSSWCATAASPLRRKWPKSRMSWTITSTSTASRKRST